MSSSENEEKKKQVNADDVLQNAIGQFGPWQGWICWWIAFMKFPQAWNLLAIVFLAPPTAHWCKRPRGLQNLTDELWRNISQPMKGQKADSCRMFDINYEGLLRNGSLLTNLNNKSNSIPCTSWEYDRSVFTETIISEWDLVCSREQLANVAQTTFMFGILLGNICCGVISDRFGRKKPLILTLMLQTLAGVIAAFVPWFEAFLVLRFISALAIGGSMIISFILCMEVVGGKWRNVISNLYHVPFSVGHLLMAGVAYATRDWARFQFVVSIVNIIFIGYCWLVPESPRWLLAVGRDDEALEVLEAAARRNGRDVSKVAEAVKTIKSEKRKESANGKKPSIVDLFRTPNLRKKTLCVYYLWMTCGLCFYGLAQYMGRIGGNIFINIGISGLIEMPGCFICMYCLKVIGRKKTMLLFLLVVAVPCLLIMVVPKGPGSPEWPNVMLSAIGIVGMSVAFPLIYLYSGELFPTVVRNVGVGSASMCARIGSMVAPFISTLNNISTYLPPLVFGVIPLIGAALCLLLPDTSNCDLPDSIEDGENFGKSKKVEVGSVNNGYISEDSRL